MTKLATPRRARGHRRATAIWAIAAATACLAPGTPAAQPAAKQVAKPAAKKLPTPLPGASYKDPAAFAEAIADKRFFKRYDAAEMERQVSEYNRHQRLQFGVNEDTYLLPERYSQITLAEEGPYFVVQVMQVEVQHSEGIDGGQDGFRSIFFEKTTLRQVSDLPGPTYTLGSPHLQLSVPAKNSCMGDKTPSGTLAVHDLERQVEIFAGQLPESTYELEGLGSSTDGSMAFTARSQHDLISEDDIDSEHHCDVGSWSELLETDVVVSCDAAAQRCKLTTTTAKREFGCPQIGGCD